MSRTSTGITPWKVMLVVGIGTFLTTLSGSTVSLALPLLGNDLQISVEKSRWIILNFLIVNTFTLLAAGRAGDMISYRKIYLWGFGIFGVMSLWCGVAQSFLWLMVARSLQAFGVTLLIAAGPALLTTTFPSQKHGQALGLFSSSIYVGLTLGAPIGGLILSFLGWRWIFLMNVPIAAIMLPFAMLLLPQHPKPSHASDTHHPLLDFALFKTWHFSGGSLSAFFNYVALFIPVVLYPYLLLEGLSFTSTVAGFILAAQPLVMAGVSSPVGWISDRLGSRLLCTAGMIFQSMGFIWISFVHETSNPLFFWLSFSLIGLGTGLFVSPNMNTMMRSAPPEKQGMASGVVSLVRSLGMIVGLTVGTTLFKSLGGLTGYPWKYSSFQAMRICCKWSAAGSAIGGLFALTIKKKSS